jgi:hypothetical protein
MGRRELWSLTLILSLAVAVGWAASAQAEGPTWYECAKQVGGKYENGCATESATGKFEKIPGVDKGKAFKGKTGEIIIHMTLPGKGDFPTVCEGPTKTEGVPTAPNGVSHVVIKFTGCRQFGDLRCQSGTKSGEIVSESLVGALGYVSKSPLEVGLELTSEAEPGVGLAAEFVCTGVAVERWKGRVIGTQSGDIDAIAKPFTLTYAVREAEIIPGFKSIINADERFEGGERAFLASEFEEGKGWEPEGGLPLGIEATLENKGELLEVRA